MSMSEKILAGIVAFALFLVFTLSIVSAAPGGQTATEADPFDLLIFTLRDAHDRGVLYEIISDLLADGFIENLIAPHTGESPDEIRERLLAHQLTPFELLITTLNDAHDRGVLPESISDLLADWLIENLIVPHTGETPEQARARLVSRIAPDDRAVLVALYNSTDGPSWATSTNWLTDVPIGDWYGVATDGNNRVVELRLRDNRLSGPIPPELGNLANLRDLDLKDNRLTGEVPAWLDSLTNLEILNLSWNRLSGTISPRLGNLSKLQKLYLGANQLGGEIPPELGKLTHLRELGLGDDLSLSGEIPPELNNLTRLEVLDLGLSEMSGPIPAWLGDQRHLRKLYLDGNQFSGEVPPELGKLTRLELLTLDGNAALLGALPQALTRMTDLYALTFHDTGLCAPLDRVFQAWLGNVSDREGPNCLSGSGGRVIVRDMFGRVVNETGIVLVDWEGHIANPAMKYSIELPGATAVLSSSEPRLYFDLPSLVGAKGPTKALASEGSGQATEFRISIFPDRDTLDERHTLTIRYTVGGGEVRSQTIDVQVIDQDLDLPLEFNVISDFSYDETGMFDDPAAREAVQQAADDWAYFIADMNLDEVRAGEELTWIYEKSGDSENGGDDVTVPVKNDVTYNGFLMYVYGYFESKIRASGGPSCNGRNQSSGVVEFPIKRSGDITFDPRGNYDTFGWMASTDESTWWLGSGRGTTPNGLYSIALHEMGHAVVFNDCHDGFADFFDVREVRDPAVMDYYGSYPVMNDNHHFFDEIDPISGRGAFGNENGGEVPLGRWIVTKLDLLIAQATGYILRDTSPFRELSLPDEPLAEGSMGTYYTHTMSVVGGIPAYYWTIDSGDLPDGLSLDSFTGTISGTPQESGAFEFTIRVRDYTKVNSGVTRSVFLNIGN